MGHILSAVVAGIGFFLVWIFGQKIVISIVCAIIIYLICFFLFNQGDNKKDLNIPVQGMQKGGTIQALLNARLELQRISVIKEKINHEAVKPLISDIIDKGDRILNYITQKEEKIESVRSFLEYYIPATYKIVNNFYMVNDISSKSSVEFQSKVVTFLQEIDEAFEKQLHALFDNEIMDASIEMETLKSSLISEGLLEENDFDKL